MLRSPQRPAPVVRAGRATTCRRGSRGHRGAESVRARRRSSFQAGRLGQHADGHQAEVQQVHRQLLFASTRLVLISPALHARRWRRSSSGVQSVTNGGRSASLRMSTGLVIGQRRTSSRFTPTRWTGAGSASSGDTRIRPRGKILTGPFLGSPRPGDVSPDPGPTWVAQIARARAMNFRVNAELNKAATHLHDRGAIRRCYLCRTLRNSSRTNDNRVYGCISRPPEPMAERLPDPGDVHFWICAQAQGCFVTAIRRTCR
jgi:hypothetical protein